MNEQPHIPSDKIYREAARRIAGSHGTVAPDADVWVKHPDPRNRRGDKYVCVHDSKGRPIWHLPVTLAQALAVERERESQ